MLTPTVHNRQTFNARFALRKAFWLVLILISCGLIGFQLSAKINSTGTLANIQKVSPPLALPNFYLRDQHGQAFDLNSLKGQWSILFFGFTQCPDICPATLQQLAMLNNTMSQQTIAGVTPQTVFVSVDPKRDSEHLAEYVEYFAKDFIGISGDMSEVVKLEQGIGAWHQYQTASDGNYQVAHSGELFLINPKGELQARLQPPLDIKAITQQLLLLMSGQV